MIKAKKNPRKPPLGGGPGYSNQSGKFIPTLFPGVALDAFASAVLFFLIEIHVQHKHFCQFRK